MSWLGTDGCSGFLEARVGSLIQQNSARGQARHQRTVAPGQGRRVCDGDVPRGTTLTCAFGKDKLVYSGFASVILYNHSPPPSLSPPCVLPWGMVHTTYMLLPRSGGVLHTIRYLFCCILPVPAIPGIPCGRRGLTRSGPCQRPCTPLCSRLSILMSGRCARPCCALRPFAAGSR